MSKKKCLIISLILLGVAIIFMIMAYFMYHYLNDSGLLTRVKHEKAEKPFVTYMTGTFSVLNLFGSLVFLLIGLINPKE